MHYFPGSGLAPCLSWSWVAGEEHPRYQHEEGKTPEMKAAIDALRSPWIGY